MQFRLFLESQESMRDFIMQAAQGACQVTPSMNCRLFVQLTTQDPEIDNYPEVPREKLKVGDVLVWGRQDGDYFQWGHYAIYLGGDEILEVPAWNQEMRVSKFTFPKSLSIRGYGRPAKIVRPNWKL